MSMPPATLALVIAAGLWVALHALVAGSPLRRAIAGAIGEKAFQGLFSLLSLAGLAALVWTYRGAAAHGVNIDLWLPPRWALWVPIAVMPISALLLVGSLTTPNPTAVGMERALQAEEPARGLLRVTRHPMLWSFTLWAAAHLAANGDLATLVLCLAIALPSVLGMFSIDRKRARRDPQGWARYAAATSIVPFAAIAGGRNRLVVAEIGLWRLAAAALAVVALIAAHPFVIGASALPY